MKNRPLLYALVLYISGILIGYHFDVCWPVIPKGIVAFLGVAMLFLFLNSLNQAKGRGNKKNRGRLSMLCTLLLGLSVFLFGLFLTTQYNPLLLKRDPKHLLHYLDDKGLPCTITGRIYLPKRQMDKREMLSIETDSVAIGEDLPPIPIKGRVRITLYEMETDLGYGDRVSVTTTLKPPLGYRNEEQYDYRQHLCRQGIYATGSVSGEDRINRISQGEEGVIRGIFSLRQQAGRLAEAQLGKGMGASLFSALLLGDRDGIDTETEKAIKRTGAVHLLAVSGLHLGIVLFFCIAAIKLTKRAIPVSWISGISAIAPYSRALSLFSLLLLGFYTVLTGMRVSTIRAFIMIALYLFAYFFDRLSDYYSTLAWAALVILIWKPLSLLEIDFQFTFLATWGVLCSLHHRPALPFLHPWVRKVADLFIISAVAVFITAPLCILYFHYLSPGGIILTPIALPILSMVIPAGLAGIAAIPFAPFLSSILIALSGTCLSLLGNMLRFFSRLPGAFFPIPSPPVILVLLFYCSAALFILLLAKRKSLPWVLSAALILLVSTWLLILAPPFLRDTADMMEVAFMDVGKGDAALIRCPSGENIVIDGGGTYDNSFDMGEEILTPFLWSKGVKRIRALALSHPHPDHIYGLFALLKNFPVEEVWVASPTLKDPRYCVLSTLMEEKGVRERVLLPGELITIGDSEDSMKVLCLHPPDAEEIYSPKGENSRENNHSMVLKISCGDISILFTGDIENEAEAFLVEGAYSALLPSTILKAPHHGSKHSNSISFLKAVSPEATIISARKFSWYPLPAPATLERLDTLPTKVYRTDHEGAITLRTDGKTYTITTWRERHPFHLLQSARY